jgi:hypothetical protein
LGVGPLAARLEVLRQHFRQGSEVRVPELLGRLHGRFQVDVIARPYPGSQRLQRPIDQPASGRLLLTGGLQPFGRVGPHQLELAIAVRDPDKQRPVHQSGEVRSGGPGMAMGHYSLARG